MVEIRDLTPLPSQNVSDDDLLLIHDTATNRVFSVTRGDLLHGIARTDDATFTKLSGEEATFTNLSAALVSFASGAGIVDMIRVEVAIPVVASGGTQTATVAVPTARVGMVASVACQAMPPGLSATGTITNQGEVIVTFTNGSSAATTLQPRSFIITLMDTA